MVLRRRLSRWWWRFWGFQTSQTLAVVPGETVNVTVGAGGAPSSFVLCGGAANGSAGGSSSITTSAGSITVTGGSGGTGGQPGGGGAGGSPGGTSGSSGSGLTGGAGGTNGTGYGTGGRGGNVTDSDPNKGGRTGTDGAIFVTWGT